MPLAAPDRDRIAPVDPATAARTVALLTLSILMAACATVPTSEQRRAHADALALARQWETIDVRTTVLPLRA
ncbi:MAG: hypothetical protein ABI794_09535 [Betaproteobacteria bacterium]